MRTWLAVLALYVAAALGAQQAGAAPANAILAGGCFWCLEHDLRKLPGVIDAVSGYSGGSSANPTYQTYHDVSNANPVPHVEVVEVTYDTDKLSFGQLLDYFYRHIDPTDGGGQFCDRGAAYRPVVYYANDQDKTLIAAKQADIAKLLKAEVAVDVLPAKTFWRAEEYHQDYAAKNPVRYQLYRLNCGRDRQIARIWAGAMTH
jgi:methionine-S-sulfoxide reductase